MNTEKIKELAESAEILKKQLRDLSCDLDYVVLHNEETMFYKPDQAEVKVSANEVTKAIRIAAEKSLKSLIQDIEGQIEYQVNQLKVDRMRADEQIRRGDLVRLKGLNLVKAKKGKQVIGIAVTAAHPKQTVKVYLTNNQEDEE